MLKLQIVMAGDIRERLSMMGLESSYESIEPRRLTPTSLISEIAPRLGIAVHLEPTFGRVGQLITPDGRKFYFKGANVDLNTLGATEIAKDKDYASYFMRELGYPVPEGRAFYSDEWCGRNGSDLNREAAYNYAEQLGFPVIVKPNSKSQGVAVQKVGNREDFYSAIDVVFNEARDNVVLVQRPVVGEDYRILVLDDEVIATYRRSPLYVVGDGQSTIFSLMLKKQEAFRSTGRDTRIKFGDPRIPAKLRGMNLDFSAIPVSGQQVNLLDNANLSTGGEAQDVTDSLHETYARMAIQLTVDMGLRFCGVDIMTDDPIDQPYLDYTIIEINASPGVDYYSQVGIEQQRVVESLYEKILLALLRPSSK